MATREIDELEYEQLKRYGVLAERLNKHPQARSMLQNAIALAMPDEAGPEIRIRQELDERFAKIEERLNAEAEARAKEREEALAKSNKQKLEKQWRDGREFARNAGYTDEGLEKLEEFMEREGIANHKHAIAAFERENPPPPQVMTGGQRFGWFDQNDKANDAALKALWEGDEETFLSHAIQAALAEVRGR